MKRLAPALLLLAAGCPLFDSESAAPAPSPTPAPTRPLAVTTPAPSQPPGHPGSRPASRPAEPPRLVEATPGTTLERDGVAVTLERIRVQPATAEALAAEPQDLSDQAADGTHFLALTLAIRRDGAPFFDLEGEEGELSLRAVALLHGVQPVVVPAGFVSRLGDRAEAVYLWRPLVPPPAVPAPLVLRVLLGRDDGDDLEFEFPIALGED